jgi:putative oxidoreductase
MGSSPRESFSQVAELGYLFLRVAVALLFIFHAPQKYFGWWNSAAFPLASLRGVAVMIELVVSPLIAVGLLTSYAAVLGAVEMIGAYWIVHRPLAPLPIENRGELALLYLIVFVFMAARGGGPYSVDHLLARR